MQKLALIAAGGASRLRTISLLQTCQQPEDEFYCVISSSTMNRVKLTHNERFEFQSEKVIVKRAHAQIMDFRQVARFLVILTCKSVYIVDALSMQELTLYENGLEPAPSLMLPPAFDVSELPLVLVQRGDVAQMEDVMYSGLGQHAVRANFKAAGIVRIPTGFTGDDGVFMVIGHEVTQHIIGQLVMFRVSLDCPPSANQQP